MEHRVRRGQMLAQIAWTVSHPSITGPQFGASSLKQIQDSVEALERKDFTEDELVAIERIAPAR